MSLNVKMLDLDRRIYPAKTITSGGASLTPTDQLVIGDVGNNSNNVYLPPTAECAGMIFVFWLRSVGTGDMKVYAKGGTTPDCAYLGSLNLGSVQYFDMDAADDRLVLYCDGIGWHELYEGIA